MSKQTETTETRSVGRPSTFPEGTELVAFPSKIPAETRDQLRELRENRKNPYGLDHNSIGAMVAHLVSQAHARMVKDRERAASRRGRKATEAPASEDN